ncbi:uncharacterized protein LOC144703430 [Wolffia australiana]
MDTTSSATEQAIASLYSVLGRVAPEPPTAKLLHDDDEAIFSEIATRLRAPSAGARDDALCRWLHDAVKSTDPSLQLAAIAIVPPLVGVYLSNTAARLPLPGLEAILLAMYASARTLPPATVTIPSADCRSAYNPAGTATAAADLPAAELAPPLQPRDAVRAAARPKIVGAALELYLSRIANVPARSRAEFCEVCLAWTGAEKVVLPWELLQPCLRILGYCLWGGAPAATEVLAAAAAAARGLLARATQEVDARAILAARSLVRAWEMAPSVEFMGEPLLFT